MSENKDELAIVEFKSTHKQRLVKAQFHDNINALTDISELTPTQIAAMTNCPSVVDWFKDGKFVQWFLNKDSEKQVIKSMAVPALKTVYKILSTSPVDGNGNISPGILSAQLKAAELMLRLGGFEPPKNIQQLNLNGSVKDMTDEEIDKELKKRGYGKGSQKPVKVLDIQGEDND